VKFIKNIIVKKIDPKFIFVSNNFRYGNKRKGDVKELITESKKYGFNVIKPEPLRIKKKAVSSTSIRDLLKKGKIKKANKLLSRNWVINGDVQRGRQLGKKLDVAYVINGSLACKGCPWSTGLRGDLLLSAAVRILCPHPENDPA